MVFIFMSNNFSKLPNLLSRAAQAASKAAAQARAAQASDKAAKKTPTNNPSSNLQKTYGTALGIFSEAMRSLGK